MIMMRMMLMMMNCWEWRKRRWRSVIRANREDFRTRYLASAARCGGSPLATSSSPRPPYHQNTSASSSSSSSIIISVEEILMKLQTWRPYPWSSRTDSKTASKVSEFESCPWDVRLNLHAVQRLKMRGHINCPLHIFSSLLFTPLTISFLPRTIAPPSRQRVGLPPGSTLVN